MDMYVHLLSQFAQFVLTGNDTYMDVLKYVV